MKSPPKNPWFYKFWNYNDKIYIISELQMIDHSKKAPFITSGLGLGYMNAKPLSAQEALELLFNKK